MVTHKSTNYDDSMKLDDTTIAFITLLSYLFKIIHNECRHLLHRLCKML